MKVLVIVINWNGGQDLIDCLSSLRSSCINSKFDVLVLDNASDSGSIFKARSLFPEFHYLILKTNLYWAGGNNQGIEWAMERNYDWIVFSNSDIIVDNYWFPAFCTVAARPEIGAVGFKVFGESKRESFQSFQDAQQAFKISELAWRDDILISGCFLAIKSDCFSKLGNFDEAYQMYSEEHDFLYRLRLAGYKTVRCNAPIWHISESASRKIPLKSSYFAIRNEIRFLIKFEDHPIYRSLRRFARFGLDMINPFKKVDFVDCCQRRKKPVMNPVLNLSILSKAFIWNFLNYNKTRHISKLHKEMAAKQGS